MIIGLHHAQLTIPKNAEEEARKFYCGILGLKEKDKSESLKGRGGFWLEVGSLEVHVGVEDGFDRTQTKAHIAYQVKSLAHWRTVLEKNKITIFESVPIPGYDRFEFRDPFGNRVEMIELKEVVGNQ